MIPFLPSFFSLKVAAIAVAIAFAVGSFSGWKVRDAFCDAAAARIEVQNLQKQLQATRQAAVIDAQSARDNATALQELSEKARELQSKISDGQCLSDAESDGVRDLWKRQGKSSPRPR